MSNRLPPLNALRAFEAAARHLSFTAAARDLHVTNAAVSHQIKQLEDDLGLVLFNRNNNRLELTAAGERYLPKVREAFRALREGTDELIGFTSVTVRLAIRHALCHYWLMPRLGRLHQAHPGIKLEFKTEFEYDYLQYDLTIDYRAASAPGYLVQQWFSTPLYPVCGPQLAQRVQTAEDLARVPLLHDRPLQGMPEYPVWPNWLAAAGLGPINNDLGIVFSSSLSCMRAAELDMGVVLGQHELVKDSIAQGKLVAPLALSAPTRMPYYLIYTTQAAEKPGILPLIEWLRGEIARDAPLV